MANHELCVCHIYTLQAVGRNERTVLCIAIELNIVYFRHINRYNSPISVHIATYRCVHATGSWKEWAISHSPVAVHIDSFLLYIFFIRLTHSPAF